MDFWQALQRIYDWPHWGETWAILLFLMGLILRQSYLHKCLLFINKPYKKYGRLFLSNLKLPMQWIFVLSSFGVLLYHSHLYSLHSPFLLRCFQTLLTFLISWGVWRQTTHTKEWIELYSEEFNHSFHEIALPLIRRSARLIIAIIFIIAFSTLWGFSTQNTIAGVGVIGIIISLSAQDLIKNTLSAFFLLVNNVFDIGDWVQLGSTSGSVESISLRFTKIKTSTHGIVSIPNSQIANSSLTNWSRREKRVVKLTFTLDPNCSGEALHKCVNHVHNKMMLNRLIFPHSLTSNLNTQGNVSPVVTFQFDIRSTNYKTMTELKLECYRDIMTLFQKYGVERVQPVSIQK